ncbi:MAG: hypothetical protein H0W62_00850 [Chitinophagales bacterium]|nr:hypothetical protein [Chitinophagales bacterium]
MGKPLNYGEAYRTMQLGGAYGIGTIIKINGDGREFEKIYSFSSGSPLAICCLMMVP